MPLTLDNVLAVVKNVRNWRGLGDWYGLRLSDDKLDAIKRQHISDEARLKAVVEAFLLGEGDYQPSWRRVIRALHQAGKSRLAEEIKANAEPHQGKWVGHSMNILCTLLKSNIFDQ